MNEEISHISKEVAEEERELAELQAFRDEIDSLRREEIRAEGVGHPKTAHFLHIEDDDWHPEQLTPRDKEIWEKLQSKELEEEEFWTWRNEVLGSDFNTRKEFSSFIANKATSHFMTKDKRQKTKN